MRRIDLNADVGEGFDDAALMPYLTSANVAAGGHAGDDESIARTVALARQHGVAVGAHPSYPDREGFGRTAQMLELGVLEQILREQLARVQRAAGRLHHVKPHGALYHRAGESHEVAEAMVRAARAIDPALYIVGPPLLVKTAGANGLLEAFADRGYGTDGKLLPRGSPDALITDSARAAAQAVRLASDAGTLCVHSDTPGAAAIAAAVRHALAAAGFEVRAP